MVIVSRSYPEYKVRFVGKWADCVDEECDLGAGHVFAVSSGQPTFETGKRLSM
jgi:hypothetical protein